MGNCNARELHIAVETVLSIQSACVAVLTRDSATYAAKRIAWSIGTS
jgi:hypothetical protein